MEDYALTYHKDPTNKENLHLQRIIHANAHEDESTYVAENLILLLICNASAVIRPQVLVTIETSSLPVLSLTPAG